MTRAEQKLIRELKKPLEKTCKEIGKRRGWKTIAGEQYQVRDGMLYMLYVSVPPIDGGRMLKASLSCKPLVLDEMYWDVFRMAEVAAKQPFNFHVRGAFTAPSLWMSGWKEPLPVPEDLEAAVEAVFDRGEAQVAETVFADLAAYRERLEADVCAGKRLQEVIMRSIDYLSLYPALGIRLLDTTALTPGEAAEAILALQ